MQKARLDKARAGIKSWNQPGEISITSDIQMTTLMAESKEELMSLLMRVKEESEKAGLNSTFSTLRLWHLVPSLHGT